MVPIWVIGIVRWGSEGLTVGVEVSLLPCVWVEVSGGSVIVHPVIVGGCPVVALDISPIASIVRIDVHITSQDNTNGRTKDNHR